jgi:hypothetical protein
MSPIGHTPPPSPSRTHSPRIRSPRASTAVLAAAAALACLCPLGYALPSSAAASSEASASVGSEPGNASLTVLDQNGRSVDVLGKLTLEQLATALHLSSAELVSEIEALPGNSSVEALLGEVLNPSATLSQVTSTLSALGLSTTPLQQLIEAHLGPLVQEGEALRALVGEILADLEPNGSLSGLASQLATTVNDLLEPQLVTSTTEGAANTLGTTTANLNGTLKAAGAIAKPLVSSTPVVVESVEKALPGATSMIATPSGTGGLTLTTVNSPSAPAAAAGVQGQKSAVFRVLSVKVTKAGLIQERVFLPKPGVVDVKATASVKAMHARKARTATLAKLASALRAGTHTLTLRPSRKGITAKRVRVGLRTTYIPSEGASATKRNSLLYRFAKAKHKH